MIHKTLFSAMIGLLALTTAAVAQPLPPYVPPTGPVPAADQMTPQTLGDMLRSATTFHEMVRGMNLNRAMGPDVHAVGQDGRYHHSVQRTAETVGAGAGVGAAIGAMSRKDNGVLIGALVGGFGGLIVDQIMKHREEAREHAAYGYAEDGRNYGPDGRGFGSDDAGYRGPEGKDRDRDHKNGDRDRREFKTRESK